MPCPWVQKHLTVHKSPHHKTATSQLSDSAIHLQMTNYSTDVWNKSYLQFTEKEAEAEVIKRHQTLGLRSFPLGLAATTQEWGRQPCAKRLPVFHLDFKHGLQKEYSHFQSQQKNLALGNAMMRRKLLEACTRHPYHLVLDVVLRVD